MLTLTKMTLPLKVERQNTQIFELSPSTDSETARYLEFSQYLLSRNRVGIAEENSKFSVFIVPGCALLWSFLKKESESQLFAFIIEKKYLSH